MDGAWPTYTPARVPSKPPRQAEPSRPVRLSTFNLQPSTRVRFLLALIAAAVVACGGGSPAPASPGQVTAAGETTGPASGSSAPATAGQLAGSPGRPATGQPTAGVGGTAADPGAAVTATAAARRDLPFKLTLGDRAWVSTLGALGLVGPAPGPAGPPELEAFLAGLAPEIEQPARNARLRIRQDGAVELTPAARGLALDTATSRARVLAAAADGRPSAELASRAVDPTLTDAQTADAAAQLSKILGREDGPIL